MFHRSSQTSPSTIKVKNLDIIHLREPTYLPKNIKLVHTKTQVARNPCNNLMEGSKFTPVNTPKAPEAPKSPTSVEQVTSSTVARPKKAATEAWNSEVPSTPNVAIKPRKVTKASISQEAASSSTPIEPNAASKSSSPEDSEASIGLVQPEAGPNPTSPQDSGSSIGNIMFTDLTNRNKTSVESLHQALSDRNLEVRGNREANTARLLLYHIGLDLDGTNTALQTRTYELLKTKMPALKVLLTRLNAALNPNDSAKGTNKPEMVERVLKAELAIKASSGDSGEGSSGSSPADHGGLSTSPASGAGQNRRGSSSPTPAPSNVDLVAASKVSDSKKRRRTEDADDADDEKEKPFSMKRQKTQVAGSETVGELSGPPVQEASDVDNDGGLDEQDLDMSDATSDGGASTLRTLKATDAALKDVPQTQPVVTPTNQDDGHHLDGLTLGAPDVDGVSGLSSPLATSTPKTDILQPQAPAKSKKRKSTTSTDPSGADTELEPKAPVDMIRPKASATGKKPQKSAAQNINGVAAEVDSKKRKREEPIAWNIDDVNTQNVPEKPHKRMKVTDEVEHTDEDVRADVSEVLEEPQQLEEPTIPEDSKQSVKRKPSKDFFIFNGILDTKVLFEDTIVPPEVLNATCRIMTGCGIMDDVNMVHEYRLGLRKYQKSHEHDHDPQKKGWRKWWAVHTFWESRVSEIEVSATSDGQSDAENGQSDASNGDSMVNGEHTDSL